MNTLIKSLILIAAISSPLLSQSILPSPVQIEIDGKKYSIEIGKESNIPDKYFSHIKKDYPYPMFWGYRYDLIPYVFIDRDQILKDNPIDKEPSILQAKVIGDYKLPIKEIKILKFKKRILQIVYKLDILSKIKNPINAKNEIVGFQKHLVKKIEEEYGAPKRYKLSIRNFIDNKSSLIPTEYCYLLWITSKLLISLNTGNELCKCNDIIEWISITDIKTYKDFICKRDEEFRKKYYDYYPYVKK